MFSKWKYDRSWRNLSKSENLRRLSIRGHFHNMAFFCKSHVNIWFETTNKFRGGLRVKMSQNIRLSQTYYLTLFENYQKSLTYSKFIFGGKIQIYPNLVRSPKIKMRLFEWFFKLRNFCHYVKEISDFREFKRENAKS